MTTTLRGRHPTFVAALAFLLVACGQDAPTPTPAPTVGPTATPSATPTSTPSAAPTPDTAWQRIDVGQSGFSIEIPPGWEEMSADILADEAFLDELTESNPDAAEALEQGRQALENGEIAFFAFDPAVGQTGFAANLNVINVGPVSESIEEAAESVAAAIEQQVPITGPVETETTTLPAGDAARVSYEWEIASDEGSTPVSVVQYAILAESGTGFILSMSAASEDAAGYEETFGRIAESFREADA